MDSMVRAEFLRKDEALRSLQNLIESQAANLRSSLQQEENNRYQAETLLREDYLKFQEIFRKVCYFSKQTPNFLRNTTCFAANSRQ